MELTAASVYILSPSEFQYVARDDDHLGYVWFADRQPGDVRYLTISRSFEDGTVHIERDDQKWGAYGGLARVEYRGGLLRLEFEPATAAELGGIESAVIDCAGIPDVAVRLPPALTQLLAGTGVRLTAAV